MANLEVIYKKSYLRGKKAYTGSFPITVVGPLGCVTPEQIAENKAYINHILSEEPDKISQSGAGLLSLDRRYEILSFDGGSLIPLETPDLFKATIVSQSLQSGNYTTTQTLSVSAVGVGVISYQWYKDDEIISNATSYHITVSSNGNYYCEAKNSLATSNSKICNLTFNPEIVNQFPNDGNYTSTQTLSVSAIGVGDYTYQWFINEHKINNANTFKINVSSNAAYYCEVNNVNGKASSVDFLITFKPEISIIPSLVQNITNSYVITPVINGVGVLNYQWYKNGSIVANATNSVLEITSGGIYSCVVTNSNGSTTSNSLTAVFS